MPAYIVGLHARPTAALVRVLSKFSSLVEVSNLSRCSDGTGQNTATARSLTSLMLLQVRHGNRIRVRASGTDAQAALKEVARLAAARFGEHGPTDSGGSALLPSRETEIPTARKSVRPPREVGPGMRAIQGVPAGDGVAMGRLRPMESCWPEGSATPEDRPRDPAGEFSRLAEAMRKGGATTQAARDESQHRAD